MHFRRSHVPRVAILLACTFTLPHAVLPAQAVPAGGSVPGSVRAQNLALNAVLGATTTALHAWIAGRPVRRALVWGAAGGALAGAGRQIVGSRGDFAGWSGRLVHEAGLGVARYGVADTLELPLHVGPLVARWTPARRRLPSVRVNLANVLLTAALASAPSARVDWGASAWSGGVVLRVSSEDLGAASGEEAWGGTLPGVIALTDDLYATATARQRRAVLAHETIHLLQFDAQHDWIGRPLEARLLRAGRIGRGLGRVVELGIAGPLAVGLATSGLPYERQPAEREAWWLTSGRAAPRPGGTTR